MKIAEQCFQGSRLNLLTWFNNFHLTETQSLFVELCYSFLKIYSTLASFILKETFYYHYLYKPCKLYVNLCSLFLCFVSHRKYPQLFNCVSKWLKELTKYSAHVLSDQPYMKLTCEHLGLKTLDTIGNCQRPVFSLGVSQHMHKITNLGQFELNWLSKLGDNNERKNTLVLRICVLLDGWFQDLKF